ncbi:NADP-dependent oxidoreductase [Kyrpidia spormannii]|uniref:NADPH:quinone reductase n=1 Tax=Kyrpidia spormannii TaxID=2055160 RepID=A0ACA8Z8R3_9BACL|nr:NADP-dependent oxidoreductase [Kyrpidia spormannii]CAB3391334.1 NADPH:quinone reductase [Kyrpidia spormannii]
MKAVLIENYGGPEQLKIADVPKPGLRETDVLIEVHAASVNPVDWKIRRGYLQSRLNHRLPLILGWDAAGTVVETGPKVTRFRVGDEVFTRPDIERDGTYAEYVAVDQSLVAKKPANLSFEEAASVPLAALTAREALIDHAGVKPGDTVLIHAGAGGVGSFAIQIAKLLGAQVITTVSTRNVDFAKQLGADRVIDYTQEDFTATLRDLDVVFDTLGGEVQLLSMNVLKKGGMLVSIVMPPDLALAEQKGIRRAYFFLQPDGKKLEEIGKWIEQGHIKPAIGAVLPLEEVAKAHELSESGHSRGKIILKVR